MFTLYTRRDCHLCSAAEQVLRAVAADRAEPVELKDIDAPSTPALLRAHYDHAVPVLHLGGHEIARHRLDPDLLHTALDLARTTLILLAKYPTPGKVKTRLAAPPPLNPQSAIPNPQSRPPSDLRHPTSDILTKDHASALHQTFLLHLLRTFATFRPLPPGRLVLCFDPPDAEQAFRTLLATHLSDLAPKIELLPQSPGNLGDRLAAAYESSQTPTLLLGCDAPDLPPHTITHTLSLLHRPQSAIRNPQSAIATPLPLPAGVICPTSDGGYWAIGLQPHLPVRNLLHEIPWSSGQEFRATLERFSSHGYPLLPSLPWDDVDHPPDLLALVRRLHSSSSPADQALLASLNSLLPPLPPQFLETPP